MSLSIGIVGLPNVGKSTLFNALLKKQVALAANYPFATIEPNVGIVPVRDDRLNQLAKVVEKETEKIPPIKPATVEFVDIAGLVKGASEGAGLGNQFLAHIRETALIAQVIRHFSDPDVIREGSRDPLTDREVIETELLLADLSTLNKFKPKKGALSAKDKLEANALTSLRSAVETGEINVVLKLISSDEGAAELAAGLNLLSIKKMIYVVNVDESELGRFSHPDEIAKLAQELSVDIEKVIVVSAKIEAELAGLAQADQLELMNELGMSQSGLDRLTQKAYELLDLQSFLTAGEIEVRAWTIKKGTKAPAAAGVIHTDFEKNFIKANVADFNDFINFGGWKGVKESGKLRLEGREYVMRDGDVVEFMVGK